MNDIQKREKSFLSHLWNVQKKIDIYIIFCKPGIFREDGGKEDEYVVWNCEENFKHGHCHVENYAKALELIDLIQKGETCNNNKDAYNTLRILDYRSPLWKKYVNKIIVEKKLIVKNVFRLCGDLVMEVKLDVYFPCPSCGGLRYDDCPSEGFKCCQKCGKTY
jgi:hypothetical protein